MRDLDQDAGPVTCLWITTASAAVGEIDENLHPFEHDIMRFPALNIRDKTDAASIVLSGLRKLGPAATSTDLKTYILGLRNFPGIDGVYDFSRGDGHGLSDQSVVMASWNTKTKDFYDHLKELNVDMIDGDDNHHYEMPRIFFKKYGSSFL